MSVPASNLEFDLWGLIRQALRASRSPDPYAVLDTVEQAIPDEELRTCVRLMLPDAIQQISKNLRRAYAETDPKVGPSHGWRAVREASHEIRTWRIPLAKGRKYLADLTVEDVRQVAEAYRGRAAANESWAKRYDRLAEVMEEAEAETAGDLPDEVLAEVLS